MKLFSLRGTVVRMHPLFPAMMFLFIFYGRTSAACAYLLVLLLHESTHWLAAQCLGIQIAQVEITPFGGSMQMDLTSALPPVKTFMLSSAGPCANLLLLLGFFLFPYAEIFANDFGVYLSSFNILMLFCNLLPVLPLDGGRMLLAILSAKTDHKWVMRILLTAGRIVAVSLIVSGALLCIRGKNGFSFCILGFYLLYAAALEEKNGTARYLAAFIARRIQFERNKTLPVQFMAASAESPLFMLLPHFRPGAYHIIEVLHPDALVSLGQLKEEAFLEAILQNSSMSLREALSAQHDLLR